LLIFRLFLPRQRPLSLNCAYASASRALISSFGPRQRRTHRMRDFPCPAFEAPLVLYRSVNVRHSAGGFLQAKGFFFFAVGAFFFSLPIAFSSHRFCTDLSFSSVLRGRRPRFRTRSPLANVRRRKGGKAHQRKKDPPIAKKFICCAYDLSGVLLSLDVLISSDAWSVKLCFSPKVSFVCSRIKAPVSLRQTRTLIRSQTVRCFLFA